MDTYNHYLISRHSWQNHELFLDYWGKPIYNILASPFAQFGINGMVVMNIICLVLSALFSFKIAQELKFKHAYLVYIFTLLSPVFLDNTISSLTEPLCALLVILTIYFLVKEKYNAGAVVAGLLPFARSEGFIILFVVFVYLLIQHRKIKAFLLLGLGSLIFNTLGWIITDQMFWIFTENPYINFELSGRNVCGNGSPFHYLIAGHYTFGKIASFLLAFGIGLFSINFIRKIKTPNLKMGLVVASFLLYFLAHAFIWWKGMMGSCGYVRVMTVIAPLASIIIVYFLSSFYALLAKHFGRSGEYASFIFSFILIFNAIYVPYRYYAYKYPLTISAEQEQYVILNDWYQQQNFEDRTKVFLYPYFSIIADISPYDQTQHLDFWKSSLQWTKKGDILIWDKHFGPNECGTPLDTMLARKDWELIKSIIPEKPIPTLNSDSFEIHVFEKIQ